MGVPEVETSWRFRETAPERYNWLIEQFVSDHREAILTDVALAGIHLSSAHYHDPAAHPYAHLGYEQVACVGRSPSIARIRDFFCARGLPEANITLVDYDGFPELPYLYQAIRRYGLNRRRDGRWHVRLPDRAVAAHYVVMEGVAGAPDNLLPSVPRHLFGLLTAVPIVQSDGLPAVRRDGALRTFHEAYNSNLFVVGSDERFYDQMPQTMLTIAVRACVRYWQPVLG